MIFEIHEKCWIIWNLYILRNIFVRRYSRNLPAKNILFNIKITAEGKCPQNIGKNRHLSVADKLNFVPTSTFLPFLLKQKRAAPNLGKETIERPHDLTRLCSMLAFRCTSFSRYFNEANTVLREISLAPLDLTRHVSGVLISRESRCWRLIEWDESNIYLQKCERSIIMFALRAGELPARVMPAKYTL